MVSAKFRAALSVSALLGLLACAASASATNVYSQDFSAYPSGTYLSNAGWTMAHYNGLPDGYVQITNSSGLAPANAITGSTSGGRNGYIGAYRNFTTAAPAGSSYVLTEQLYLRPGLEYASVGFWDGTVQPRGNGDPDGIYIVAGGGSSPFYLVQESVSTSSGSSSFGAPLTAGIYSVALHLDGPSETAWATVLAPNGQLYTSPTLALSIEPVATMTGVQLYMFHHSGTQADFGNMSVDTVPEPASLGMLALAGLGLCVRRRR